MRNLKALGIGLVLGCAILGASALGALPTLKTDKIFVAESKKSKTYIGSGIIVGGDWAIDDVVIKGIRQGGANPGFERVVIDLDGNRGGEPAALERPPYYHVAVSGEQKRIVITIMGKPKLKLEPSRVMAAFKKSKLVSRVELLPMVEKDRWSFVLNLKQSSGVEVFELNKPTRIILDLQPRRSAAALRLQHHETTEEN